MTTNKKITKRERFNSLLSLSEVQADADLVAFIEHEIELLDKKNSGEKKPTAQQAANEVIKQGIVNGMQKGRLYTVTELIKEIDECADLTNQKVSSLLRQLISENKVVKSIDKRKSYFQIAD